MDKQMLIDADINSQTMLDQFKLRHEAEFYRPDVEKMIMMQVASLPPALKALISAVDPEAGEQIKKVSKEVW